MLGQRLVEIERLEFTTPIGGQTVLRRLGPKLIEVWISGVEALQDALDQLSPLNRWKQSACSVNFLMCSFISNRIAGESDGLKAGHRRAAPPLMHDGGW